MILSFKNKFVDPILLGEKIHTFRHDKSKRWKAGNKIHFSTGIRTKNYNCFLIGKCYFVQECVLVNSLSPYIMIDGSVFYVNQLYSIARNDGFSSTDDFMDFFFPDHCKNFGAVNLRLIHWTNFKY